MISSLRFINSVKWTDKGNFTCKAINSPISFMDGLRSLAIQTSTTQISVIHEPVILNERFPLQALAAADIGTTVIIVSFVKF